MSTISKQANVLTLINVFTVDPAKQQQLVTLPADATEQTMKHVPGFISASIHRALDGSKVVNYAQWRDKASFEAMQRRPEAAAHIKAAAALARFDPILCEVAESIDA